MTYSNSYRMTINFRLMLVVILILLLFFEFLVRIEDGEKNLERVSIQQTRQIIDSAAAVLVAGLVSSGNLQNLNRLDRANPFALMQRININASNYLGEFETRNELPEEEFGWFYIRAERKVLYRAKFEENSSSYSLNLDYDDRNQSGIFEQEVDAFYRLSFEQLPQ